MFGIPAKPVDVFHVKIVLYGSPAHVELALETDNCHRQDRVGCRLAVGVLDLDLEKRRHQLVAFVTAPEMGQLTLDVSRSPTLPSRGFQSSTSTVNS